MEEATGTRSWIRELEPLRWLFAGCRTAVRYDRHADSSVDACHAQFELWMGTGDFWGSCAAAVVASESESHAHQHENEPTATRARRHSEALQGRSAADAVRNHAGLPRSRHEPVQLVVRMSANASADANLVCALLCVSEHD